MKKRRKDKLNKLFLEEGSNLSPEQKKIIEETRFLIKSIGQEKLPSDEKQQLWSKISYTIETANHKSFKTTPFISWLRVAATVTILLTVGLGYYVQKWNSQSEMEKVAESLSAQMNETSLVLSDKRAITLRKDNSKVIYKNEGAIIDIDSSADINQKTGNGESAYNSLVVPFGKRASLKLYDGTEIWLNSGSKLVFPTRFAEASREVYLEGQAYFSVSHKDNVPFFVHTKNIKIEVLGTEFDVSAYNDDSETYAVLAKGSIELTANKKSLLGALKKKMVPGTLAGYNSDNKVLNISKVNTGDYTAWKDGYLILNKVPLNDILTRLSRYYNVDFLVQDKKLGTETFSGKLDLQEDVVQVMDIITAATSTTYQQMERRFILERNTIKK